jgi:UDP-N-acetyl-L-fucosamine synthase
MDFNNKCLLITGGTGSFGNAVLRRSLNTDIHEIGQRTAFSHQLVTFLKPFGFTDFVYLQMHAVCTISDSVTISEESAILSFPAISPRNSMERPESQYAGTIFLTGYDKALVMESIELAMSEYNTRKYSNNVVDYSINDTSWRVVKLIQGLAGLSNTCSGNYKK